MQFTTKIGRLFLSMQTENIDFDGTPSPAKRVRHSIALAYQLFRPQLKAKFSRSFLGYFWIIFPIVVLTVAAHGAHQSGIMFAPDINLPFFIFYMIGVVAWLNFGEALMLGVRSVEASRSFIARVRFPMLSIVLSQLFAILVDGLIRILFVALMSLAFGIDPLRVILSCGIILFGTVFAAMLGAFIAPFALLVEDVKRIFQLFLSFGLLVSPVFFQPRPGTTLETVLYFHPIAPIALPARKAMAGAPIDIPLSIVFGLTVLGLLIIGLRFFIKAKPLIVERMLLGGR
ncbi:hypothetical protein ELI38_02750 [Rhizobium leguminosarum]|jgi:ABC-type polysaccharide/polyol phosphate export permease|uniref:Transport permease protein n=2 Tax=Rhizobium leguminosarum TaxID=384 RepID=A0A1B8R8U9_RHILT|nr:MULTISPECIES: hypothetical protein [Rhizobium]AOO91923.1 hypothetical protein [Rhizobium leguminosarum bv. trifolii]MBY5468570.1 hypothetical protein [Rhizobium leguminosarum]MBY5917764.1 hypothetical protein [Rhizobium leguminosarum]MCJ9693504.1 hypothetical protein [Rhizobium sp. PRIMUS64]MDV4159678.1 hypothetical protein [Rhizobium leguminosarum]